MVGSVVDLRGRRARRRARHRRGGLPHTAGARAGSGSAGHDAHQRHDPAGRGGRADADGRGARARHRPVAHADLEGRRRRLAVEGEISKADLPRINKMLGK